MSFPDAYRSGFTYGIDTFKASVHKAIVAWMIRVDVSKSKQALMDASLSGKHRRGGAAFCK